MKSILMVLFVAVSLISHSQFAYINTYGGSQSEDGKDLVQTPDGGFFGIGSTSSNSNNNNSQVYLIKLDSTLTFEWSKVYGNGSVESGQSIVKTEDDNYLILANVVENNDYQLKLYKIDIHGDLIWSEIYGGSDWDFGNKIIATTDGFIIAGYTYSIGAGQKDAYLIYLDAAGEIQWENSYGGEENDSFKDVAIDNDGNIIAVGKTNSYTTQGYYESYFTKISMVGDTLWTKTHSTDTLDTESTGIAISPTNMMIVGSNFTSNKAWQMNYFTVDDLGNISNYSEYGNAANDYFYDVVYFDENYFLSGETFSYGSGEGDGYFFKSTIDGNWEGSPTYGNIKNDKLNSIIVSEENYVIAIGTTKFFFYESQDILLVKIAGTNFFLDPDEEIYTYFQDLTISIDEMVEIANELTTYPNPFKNSLTIETKANQYTIKIYNSSLQEVYNNKVSVISKHQINLDNIFSAGIYFITLEDQDRNIVARKTIIKE